MTRRHESDPVAEQNREDAARRADEARSDAEHDDWAPMLVASGAFRGLARHGELPPLTWDEDDEIAERDALLDVNEKLDNKEGL